MITKKALPRRTFLRVLGAAVGLPFLDAMTPALSAAVKAPVRMVFVYVPNGMDVRNWNLDYEGKLGQLSRIMAPLEPHKEDILVTSNLTHNNGRALLDGAGDHGRCCGSYLTGVQPKKSPSSAATTSTANGRMRDNRLGGSCVEVTCSAS